MNRLVLIGCAVLACATACGGGGTKLYTAAATKACLRKQSVPVRSAPASDFVANSATGGAFSATTRGNHVTVSFGETVADAENIDQAYRRFHAKNVGIDDVLRTQGNAVMLWHLHPLATDISTLTDCLKG